MSWLQDFGFTDPKVWFMAFLMFSTGMYWSERISNALQKWAKKTNQRLKKAESKH